MGVKRSTDAITDVSKYQKEAEARVKENHKNLLEISQSLDFELLHQKFNDSDSSELPRNNPHKFHRYLGYNKMMKQLGNWWRMGILVSVSEKGPFTAIASDHGLEQENRKLSYGRHKRNCKFSECFGQLLLDGWFLTSWCWKGKIRQASWNSWFKKWKNHWECVKDYRCFLNAWCNIRSCWKCA